MIDEPPIKGIRRPAARYGHFFPPDLTRLYILLLYYSPDEENNARGITEIQRIYLQLLYDYAANVLWGETSARRRPTLPYL